MEGRGGGGVQNEGGGCREGGREGGRGGVQNAGLGVGIMGVEMGIEGPPFSHPDEVVLDGRTECVHRMGGYRDMQFVPLGPKRTFGRPAGHLQHHPLPNRVPPLASQQELVPAPHLRARGPSQGRLRCS
jgi:hypothetical protein